MQTAFLCWSLIDLFHSFFSLFVCVSIVRDVLRDASPRPSNCLLQWKMIHVRPSAEILVFLLIKIGFGNCSCCQSRLPAARDIPALPGWDPVRFLNIFSHVINIRVEGCHVIFLYHLHAIVKLGQYDLMSCYSFKFFLKACTKCG